MSSYMFVYSNCASCNIPIAFNPLYVPSIRIHNKGEKKAICVDCWKRGNEIHRKHDPLQLHPKAYKPTSTNDLNDLLYRLIVVSL